MFPEGGEGGRGVQKCMVRGKKATRAQARGGAGRRQNNMSESHPNHHGLESPKVVLELALLLLTRCILLLDLSMLRSCAPLPSSLLSRHDRPS